MQEVAAAPKGAVSLHGHVPSDLVHPPFVRVNRHPGDIHPAALEMDEKQHVVGHQPCSVSTSAVKKSVPASSAKWIRMNADQVVVRLRSGAGGTPWRRKTFPTV